MKQINTLSDTEWEIIKAVWEKKEATIKEVWQAAFPNNEKAYTTIQTYMDRMVEKGILKKRKLGLVNFYSARIEKQKLMKRATENLVTRVFDGSIGQLAAFLVNSYDLSPNDLDELRNLIAKKEKEK